MHSPPPAPLDPTEAPLPLLPDAVVPDYLPGEPRRGPPSTAYLTLRLTLRLLGTALLMAMALPLWPLLLIGAWRRGWPPHVLRPARAVRWLRVIAASPGPPRGAGRLTQLWLGAGVVQGAVAAPFPGLAWLLDELVYGRRLDAVRVERPLIEISAARSGSTQLARYLEPDERLVAPTVAQSFAPYLWLWRLMAATVGRWVDREALQAWFHRQLPPEFTERHEGRLFGTDTFEAPFYLAQRLPTAAWLGAEVFAREFGQGAVPSENRALWEDDFVRWFDRIARKALLFAGAGDGRRAFVKGHFLAAADALAARYPDGCFVTMVRPPAARLQSAVNFLRANRLDGALGAAPWAVIAEGLVRSEIAYCDTEMAWFTRVEGPRRCALRFGEYVDDLEGTMARVYAACFDGEAPPEAVPRVHTPRVRRDYVLDRSLAQVGIDGAALDRRLARYVAWCRGERGRGEG